MNLIKIVKNWYSGTLKIHEFENNPDSMLVFLPSQRTEYHWSAKIARTVVGFLLKEWKWLAGLALAIAGLILKFQ